MLSRLARLESMPPRKGYRYAGPDTRQLVIDLCGAFGVDGAAISQTAQAAADKGFTCIMDEVAHAIASKLGCDPGEVRDWLKQTARGQG